REIFQHGKSSPNPRAASDIRPRYSATTNSSVRRGLRFERISLRVEGPRLDVRGGIDSPRRLRVGEANGLAQQFGGISQLQLFLDACAIRLDRLYADIERLRDASCLITLTKQPKDLEFPVTELLDRRVMIGNVAIRETLGDHRLHPGAQIELPVEHIANRRGNAAGRLAFHDIAAGTRPESA